MKNKAVDAPIKIFEKIVMVMIIAEIVQIGPRITSSFHISSAYLSALCDTLRGVAINWWTSNQFYQVLSWMKLVLMQYIATPLFWEKIFLVAFG